MTKLTRRNFLKAMGSGGLVMLSGISTQSWGANAHVVVIGGGTGGATAAKYLKKADPSLRVTLIEKNTNYHTCYMSNEVIGGSRTLDSLKFGYDGLRQYGVDVVHDTVTAIDYDTNTVNTESGASYIYDRCIVSPGIGFHFDKVDGYDATIAETTIPHSWKAGAQTTLLRSQLEAMPDGGTFVLAAPPNPYRCPPAPYERASQVAHYFKANKPASKILILDPKTSFAKQPQFEEAWMKMYGYGGDNAMIEWVSGTDNLATALDAATRTVTTANGTQHTSDVLNIIPAQKAGAIAFTADLTDESGWCPIHVSSFESTRHANIHVIGDASNASPLPKSGYAANSSAKACALAVAALLNGREPQKASYSNGCYSIVGDDYAISILAIYQLSDDGRKIEKISNAGGSSRLGASDADHKIDMEYAYSWYNNFTRDIFF